MTTLNLDAVSKVYGNPKNGVRAVDAIDLAIDDGEIIGLLGSSGCGKTSTLRMIAGFESVSDGAIRLGARLINDLAPAQRNVAMAFEGYALYPPLTVRDNIGFALLRDRRPRAEVEAKVQEIADLLEIAPVLKRYPPLLSAGQQQRTSLARALIRQADAYLLDEPMSQLEPQLRAVLRARIKDWLISRHMTTVFVTHDQTEAIALADRIAVMEQGVLQQFAAPHELKQRPANLFVASFIGEPPMNVYPAVIARDNGTTRAVVRNARGEVAFALDLAATVDLVDGRAVHVGVRPHRLSLGDGAHSVSGEVSSNAWLGDQTHLGIELDGHLLIAVTYDVVSAPVGSRINLVCPPEAVHVFAGDSGQALYHGREAA